MQRSYALSMLPFLVLAACEITVVEDKSDTGGTTDYADADTDTDTDADADADTDADADADTDTDTGTPPMSLLDIAQGDPNLSLLVEAAVHAGLDDELDAPGSMTLFAPSNTAFEAAGLDSKTIAAYDAAALADVLLYHVVDGSVDSASVPDRADSLATWTLFFDTTKGVMVNDATVTMPDVMADNGIAHVVDTVLMPPTILDAAGYANLEGLVVAVGGADPSVATMLSSEGDLTVMAPTDQAFADAVSLTKKMTPAELTEVLQYHVVEGSIESSALPEKADSALLNGQSFGVSMVFDAKGALVNGTAISDTDIRTTNGIIHVVDGVLLPPNVVQMAELAGLTDYTATLAAASGNLEQAFADERFTFTLFGPDNQAFYDAAATVSGLSPNALQGVMNYHASQAYFDSASMAQDDEIPTAFFPNSLTVDLSAGLTVEGAAVTLADLHSTNGVVHVIDTVLIPPTDTTTTN